MNLLSPIPIPTPWPVPPVDPDRIDLMAPLFQLENYERVVSVAQGVVVMVGEHSNLIIAVVVVGVVIATIRWLKKVTARTDNEV